ncbi:hypothetical protein V8G54_009379 [Vigna mungo]|uniref:Uncharacterized protein n=1 Tax=Vigna mungo TaxID=3915 RepID=A0AAQ3S3T1_VIGMU
MAFHPEAEPGSLPSFHVTVFFFFGGWNGTRQRPSGRYPKKRGKLHQNTMNTQWTSVNAISDVYCALRRRVGRPINVTHINVGSGLAIGTSTPSPKHSPCLVVVSLPTVNGKWCLMVPGHRSMSDRLQKWLLSGKSGRSTI